MNSVLLLVSGSEVTAHQTRAGPLGSELCGPRREESAALERPCAGSQTHPSPKGAEP